MNPAAPGEGLPPRISVLMPVYNGETYLEDAVASVLGQTFRDFELVLVDDGSTDGSRALIGELAAQDSRVRPLLLERNGGLPRALNLGMANCRGEWIARLDADDLALPNRLERQLEFASAHPDAVLIGSDVNFIDGRSRLVGRDVRLPTAHEQIDAALLWGLWPIIHPAVLMQRAALEAIGGYDETLRMSEDHDLFLRLAEVGRLYSIPERLTRYRLHSGQMTALQKTDPLWPILEKARARRGIELPSKPLGVRLFGMGVSYAVDMEPQRNLLQPLRSLGAAWTRPGAWVRCASAYAVFAGCGIARALERLFSTASNH